MTPPIILALAATFLGSHWLVRLLTIRACRSYCDRGEAAWRAAERDRAFARADRADAERLWRDARRDQGIAAEARQAAIASAFVLARRSIHRGDFDLAAEGPPVARARGEG
jgi:hypothetical protein